MQILDPHEGKRGYMRLRSRARPCNDKDDVIIANNNASTHARGRDRLDPTLLSFPFPFPSPLTHVEGMR